MTKQIPIVDYLVLDGDDPHLVANRSVESGALYFDRRNADAKTGAPGFEQQRLANEGAVRSFTIVYRAAPGVPTPYVSCVVDLDGGGVVKANLINIEPDPDRVDAGMRVRMTTFPVGTDDDGTEAIAFGYEPA
ncbi:MAG TPA: OB-fold domain-containing protein [Acidimicrobiia bacterium]|nr:OB-fold domain-containing protein [Acidimicrobiia bacterium]